MLKGKKKRIFLFLLFVVSIISSFTFIPVGKYEPSDEMEIYLISSAIHTDIVVPVHSKVFNWLTFLNPNDFKAPATEWIELGWGDRQYYFEVPSWDQFTLKIGVDALFTPDPGIMHVSFLEGHPSGFLSARKIKISYKTYEKLVEALKKQFVQKDGKPILIPMKGYSPLDNFYEGIGSFSLIRTCNVWTSDMLAEVGLKHPLWSPTKYGLELMWKN